MRKTRLMRRGTAALVSVLAGLTLATAAMLPANASEGALHQLRSVGQTVMVWQFTPKSPTAGSFSCYAVVTPPFYVSSSEIEVDSTVWCDIPMTAIAGTLAIFRGASARGSSPFHAALKTYVAAKETAKCGRTYAYWRGIVSVTLIPPPGFYPPVAHATRAGPALSLRC